MICIIVDSTHYYNLYWVYFIIDVAWLRANHQVLRVLPQVLDQVLGVRVQKSDPVLYVSIENWFSKSDKSVGL